ncbi:MAG: SCO family protein [Bacteroidetes bacterium]|nr:MAG: SCO family protein [Bacteroidota bacterium]REK55414.1 MAG: SCO family protein [Bacteroidota bacterium]
MNLKPSEWLKIGVLILVFVVGSTAAYQILQPKPRLPIYNPSDLNPAVVDDDLERVGRGHRIGDFDLVDQWGNKADSSLLQGKIYVADFFFTTCPTICIDMGANFQRIQETYKDEDRFHLVSHTVMPEIDTVEVMHAYGERMGAIKGKWHLLTGEKRELYRMARREYFAVMEQGTSFDEHDFIHTENVILVDEKKRIRGFYDGTSDLDIDRLIGDIQILLDRK